VKNCRARSIRCWPTSFALYLKTKNFHWHMSGPHFRDYHLLLDEQADQIFKISDDIAERVRKIGGQTIRSIGQIARLHRCRRGRQFPARIAHPAEIFTPEDLNEEQRQIAATAARFAREEILPRVAAIEAKEPGAMARCCARPPSWGSPPSTFPKSTAAWGWTR
jgi:hypothetical protein